MTRFTGILTVILGIGLVLTGGSQVLAEKISDNPQVALQTSKGKIVLELYPDKAPVTVKNFLEYVDSDFYDGTIFHRVIKDFMIQGGGFTSDMKRKKTQDPIVNEADNGLKNAKGTIAMARTMDPHSATAQFFINLKDNAFLDFKSKTPRGWGYTVFGKVIQGMDVVEAIGTSPTTSKGRHRNVPADTVLIEEAVKVK
jgi:peptidyl-prolyl cis-trans isomerase B (cyclophilin B)